MLGNPDTRWQEKQDEQIYSMKCFLTIMGLVKFNLVTFRACENESETTFWGFPVIGFYQLCIAAL